MLPEQVIIDRQVDRFYKMPVLCSRLQGTHIMLRYLFGLDRVDQGPVYVTIGRRRQCTVPVYPS